MRVTVMNPELGYLRESLFVPKKYIAVDATKAALSFSTMNAREVRMLTLWQDTPDHLVLPREFWSPGALAFPVVDCRFTDFPTTRVRSNITLDLKEPTKTTQRDAVAAMRASRGGILQLACGKGKTVCALELIAQEGVPALIVVDNSHLMEQWQKEIAKFLDIPDGLGLIKGDKLEWQKDVVLTTYQTLSKRYDELPEEIRRHFGLIIWDEAHHMAAPTWLRTADMFVGKRIGLTATPTRADGMHVVYDFHLGPIVYSDLRQELVPEIFFMWTGLEVDITDKAVKEKVCDVNGELHISMLNSYFGQWRRRLDLILKEVRAAAAQGRKILVLSYSVAELVNMFGIWNNETDLYSDIPEVTPADVGETESPVPLDLRTELRLKKKMGALIGLKKNTPPAQLPVLQFEIDQIELRLKRAEVWKKVELEGEKKRRAYIREVLKKPSTAGLMIGAIKAKERAKMLEERQVTFAIMKYGREGLDESSLDTVFVCEPLSQEGGLQQLMGRVLRIHKAKKTPIVVFFEDDVGPMIGMCSKLRKYLNHWPTEQNGPLAYTLVGHPRKGKGIATWKTA